MFVLDSRPDGRPFSSVVCLLDVSLNANGLNNAGLSLSLPLDFFVCERRVLSAMRLSSAGSHVVLIHLSAMYKQIKGGNRMAISLL
jgi:hypothetical protein